MKFLFHTGSIKSDSENRVVGAGGRFYSILVRLKDLVSQGHDEDTIKFLFHTGSIKRHVLNASSEALVLFVSIPYWFD